MPIIAAAIPAVLGAVKFFAGRAQEKKAQKERDAMREPFYTIRDQYFQNVNQAENLAQQGFDQTTTDQFTKAMQQKQQAGLSTILSVSNDPNQVSQMMDSYSNAIGSFYAQSAQQRIGNIERLMATRKDLAGQYNTQWGVNEYAPFQNKLKEITERRAAAQETMWSGINDVASAATSYAGYKMNQAGNIPMTPKEKLFNTLSFSKSTVNPNLGPATTSISPAPQTAQPISIVAPTVNENPSISEQE